ncbi:MAG: helicase-related protein [bacterium]|nr:helicase-related protein [bacterium]
MSDPKPELATNRAGRTVAEALNGYITHAATGFVGGARLDIASAYFNVGGYSLLADSLDHLTGARLLLGAEPTPPESRPRVLGDESARPERAAAARLRRALEGHERDLRTDRDLLGFSVETDAAVRRLVGWLRGGKVQVRRLEGRFLHGKAFLVSDRSHGVVAGSSNFTHAGLATNLELNLGNYSPHVVRQVQEWFEELWAEAVDYDLAALFEGRFEPHPPQLIYLRMLWQLYGDDLAAEAAAEGAPQIHLTSFQTDGLWRARRILDEHNGVLVADEVGLGKTFLAGELIREAALDRRQRVLVITPATLRDGPWRAFRSEFNLPMELVSYEQLAADPRLNPDRRGAGGARMSPAPATPTVTTPTGANPTDTATADTTPADATGARNVAAGAAPTLAARDVNDYAMVVIDEAQNLRNPSTQRAEALRRLLAGMPPKKLVLLSATPVNNSLWDLYYLLGYFLHNDATFAEVGIRSLRDHFATAMAQNPGDLSPEHLFDVLDAVAVRRTRSFVKRFYPNDTVRLDGREQPITFPTPRVRRVVYDLDAVLPGFFDRIERALDPDAEPNDPEVLTLARYAPSQYRHDRALETYEVQLAGLLRSGLLKRFESSPFAFALTCERMAASHDAFLSLLNNGRVATGEALADWIATDSDDIDEVDKYLDAHVGLTDDATGYDVARLRAHVARDRELLGSLAADARTVTRADDPTLAELVEQLAEIAAEAEFTGLSEAGTRDRRKVLIFSYYADTVDWIVEYLEEVTGSDERLAPYRGRIASLSGSTGAAHMDTVVWGFAPRTTDAPHGRDEDRFDIVVTTDVLAEGVNLQQARHIINYDLPWNPMRLVQRHGRIDRIGSHHSEVFIRCIFPDARLDDLLGLEERLHLKLTQAAASIGVGEVLPGQTGRDTTFTETREEIERIRREDATLFERGGTARGALSGEEYRQELRRAVEQGHREHIEGLPWGSGSGMAVAGGDGRTGYVFCVQVGDRPQPLFRCVEYGADERDSGGVDRAGDRRGREDAGGRGRSGDAGEDPGDGYGEGGRGGRGMDTGRADRPGAAGDGLSSRNAGADRKPVIVAETLACLDRARPPDGFDTPRVLDDNTYRRAFDAWEVARADIVEQWNHLADPANLQPRVPPALRRAADILRSHPPAELTSDEIDRTIDAICAPYPERIIRTFRAAMASTDDPAAQAANVLGVVHNLGLEPYEPPQPLPEITPDDVHLVCWLALV